MGVVELQALRFRSWSESNALQLQLLLFPRWNDWLNGVKAPVLLDDWMQELTSAFNKFPKLQAFSADIFESNRLFRVFALGHIERNRQQIMAKRSVDNGGMFVSWSGTSRLYSKQLGVTLENEGELRPAQGTMSTGDPAILQEMREERKLRMEELKQTREIIAMLVSTIKGQGGDTPVEAYAKEFSGAVEDGVMTQEVEVIEEDPAQYVSFGADPESVDLTEAEVQTVPEDSPERAAFDAAMEDPAFEAAVEADPGLRGAIKDNPALMGAIEEDAEIKPARKKKG